MVRVKGVKRNAFEIGDSIASTIPSEIAKWLELVKGTPLKWYTKILDGERIAYFKVE